VWTAGYVKLLLPPRQSRGNSHWGLGRPAVLGQATPKERTDSQSSAPSPVVEAVPLLSRRLRVDAASGETPKAAPTREERVPQGRLSAEPSPQGSVRASRYCPPCCLHRICEISRISARCSLVLVGLGGDSATDENQTIHFLGGVSLVIIV
jgi:hypothetical protein